jgi:hypothetical protein
LFSADLVLGQIDWLRRPGVLARREVSKDAGLLVLRHAAGGFLEARDYRHGGAP